MALKEQKILIEEISNSLNVGTMTVHQLLKFYLDSISYNIQFALVWESQLEENIASLLDNTVAPVPKQPVIREEDGANKFLPLPNVDLAQRVKQFEEQAEVLILEAVECGPENLSKVEAKLKKT